MVRWPSQDPWAVDNVACFWLGEASWCSVVQLCTGPSGLAFFSSNEDKSFLSYKHIFLIESIVLIIMMYDLLFTFFVCFPE